MGGLLRFISVYLLEGCIDYENNADIDQSNTGILLLIIIMD